MRSSPWCFVVGVCLAAVPAAAGSARLPLPSGPWRLFQLFEPVPGPQRGVDVWALESDLGSVASKHAGSIAVTTVSFDEDQQTAELRKTSYYTSEYNCSTGQSRTLRFREVTDGRVVRESRTAERWSPIIPHTFGARVLGFICDGAKVDDLKRAITADQALAIERKMDREFNQARAREQADQNSSE